MSIDTLLEAARYLEWQAQQQQITRGELCQTTSPQRPPGISMQREPQTRATLLKHMSSISISNI